MLPLSSFTAAAHSIASRVIGAEPLTIGGGAAVQGVMNEATFNRDYEQGGFEQSATLDVVISVAAFTTVYPAAVSTYQGEKATARGINWRVSKISKGASFVQISLIAPNKSA